MLLILYFFAHAHADAGGDGTTIVVEVNDEGEYLITEQQKHIDYYYYYFFSRANPFLHARRSHVWQYIARRHVETVSHQHSLGLFLPSATHTATATPHSSSPHVTVAQYSQEMVVPGNQIAIQCQTSGAIRAEQGIVESLHMTKAIFTAIEVRPC